MPREFTDNAPRNVAPLLSAHGLRVKRTPLNAKYGVRVNAFDANNVRAWVGEVGVLHREMMTGRGWWQAIIRARFPGGRSLVVAEAQLVSTEAPLPEVLDWAPSTGVDLDDFVIVKKDPNSALA